MEDVDLSNAYLCMQCHTCSAACTAAPVNGLRPREIVLRAARGDPTLLEEAEVPWLCVTCYSCTEQCRAGIDVTELFYRLREHAAERGHIPAPYRAVAEAVDKTGLAFPNTKRTARMREELGLPPFEVSSKTIEELRTLFREVGLPVCERKEAS
jgi:heterodisulfide reductase subunit C